MGPLKVEVTSGVWTGPGATALTRMPGGGVTAGRGVFLARGVASEGGGDEGRVGTVWGGRHLRGCIRVGWSRAGVGAHCWAGAVTAINSVSAWPAVRTSVGEGGVGMLGRHCGGHQLQKQLHHSAWPAARTMQGRGG